MKGSLRDIQRRSMPVCVNLSALTLTPLPRAVLRPGESVAVEALGYRPAWEALRLAGAQLVPVPVDAEGLDVDALERLARRRRLRAVYVTPHHQLPTTVTMAAGRRLALLALARRHGLLVIEDDYDHEFHYEGRPVLPLASADDAGVVASVARSPRCSHPGCGWASWWHPPLWQSGWCGFAR